MYNLGTNGRNPFRFECEFRDDVYDFTCLLTWSYLGPLHRSHESPAAARTTYFRFTYFCILPNEQYTLLRDYVLPSVCKRRARIRRRTRRFRNARRGLRYYYYHSTGAFYFIYYSVFFFSLVRVSRKRRRYYTMYVYGLRTR